MKVGRVCPWRENSLKSPPPSPPPPFTIVQSLGAQRLATLLDHLVQVPPSVPDCHSVGPDGWGGDLQLQPPAMAPLAGTTAEMVAPPVCHNPSETLSAPVTGEGYNNVNWGSKLKGWWVNGHLPPRVHVKEVVSAAFIACCLFTGSHSWGSCDPYSFLFVISDKTQVVSLIYWLEIIHGPTSSLCCTARRRLPSAGRRRHLCRTCRTKCRPCIDSALPAPAFLLSPCL